MKHLAFLCIFNITCASLYAASTTYTVTNSQGDDTNGITDNAGNLLSGTAGSVGIGFFTDDNSVTTAVSSSDLLDADWTIYDAEFNFTASQAPLFFEGLYEGDATVSGVNQDPYVGQNIYLVLGNSSTLATSADFIVYKFNETFVKDNGPTPIELLLDADTYTPANLLIGSIGADQTVRAGDSTAQPTFQMTTLIPEPSSTAMLGLGGMMLLLRRRK